MDRKGNFNSSKALLEEILKQFASSKNCPKSCFSDNLDSLFSPFDENENTLLISATFKIDNIDAQLDIFFRDYSMVIFIFTP